MLLVIDNYDSFTYNLVQYFGELGASLRIYRNDKISIKRIEKMAPEKILISPGPGRPENAGVSVDVVKNFFKDIPILGVCLGHQVIGHAFEAKIIQAKKLMHGKTSLIYHKNQGIFKGIQNPFEATRYHSLVIDKKTLPSFLEIIAQTQDHEIMGIRHKKFPLFGVQFHPESILTKEGKTLLRNFIEQ